MFLIDIAVPRDLDPEINRVRDAYLYDIDDLQHVVEHNRSEREKDAAARRAHRRAGAGRHERLAAQP